MKKKIIAITLCAITTLGIAAQTEITKHIPGVSAEGITYFLPQTVIDVTIEAEKVTYTPGEFCKYANKYLRLQGISDSPEVFWEIKDIHITPNGIPDNQKGYTIKLKDKTIAPLVELTEDGIILSINRETEKSSTPDNKVGTEEPLHIDPKDILGEEILSATSTAKMAELVAKEIYNIRESKNAILRGQAENMPKDGESLKIILRNLEAQDEALTNMFKGVTTREKRTLSLRLTPNNDQTINKEVLFRFSRKLGIVSADDLSGNPIYYDLENLYPQTDNEETNKKAKRPQGIVYNLPGKAQLKIYNTKEVFIEEELPIAQFGQTDVLANDLFNKNANTQVTFDPTTGAVLKIERE